MHQLPSLVLLFTLKQFMYPISVICSICVHLIVRKKQRKNIHKFNPLLLFFLKNLFHIPGLSLESILLPPSGKQTYEIQPPTAPMMEIPINLQVDKQISLPTVSYYYVTN